MTYVEAGDGREAELLAVIADQGQAAAEGTSPLVIAGINASGAVVPFLVERVTTGFPVITTDHALIHEGIAYTLDGIVTVSTSYSIAFTTPADAYVHFKPVGISAAGGPVTATILEGPTFTGGTPATPVNRNRLVTNPAGVAVALGVTPSGGTTIAQTLIPGVTTGATRVGAATGAAEEFVLKRSTVYVLTLAEAATGDVQCGYSFFWYEEPGA